MASRRMERWAKGQKAWIKAQQLSLAANQMGADHSRAIARLELKAAAAGDKLIAIQAAAIHEVRRELKAAGF